MPPFFREINTEPWYYEEEPFYSDEDEDYYDDEDNTSLYIAYIHLCIIMIFLIYILFI